MATTEIYTSSQGRITVDLQTDRAKIVQSLLDRGDPGYDSGGQLEALRKRVDNLEDLLRAALMGSSRRTFRHVIQHCGLAVTD